MARQYAGDFHAHVAGEREDLIGLVARVDDHGFAALARSDDPAVFLKEANHNATDFELHGICVHVSHRA
jgi:hypothetical protein